MPASPGASFSCAAEVAESWSCTCKHHCTLASTNFAHEWLQQESQDSVSYVGLRIAGKDGCVPWLVNELGNLSTHWCTRAELAAVLGSLARIPALSAAMASLPTLLCFPALSSFLCNYCKAALVTAGYSRIVMSCVLQFFTPHQVKHVHFGKCRHALCIMAGVLTIGVAMHRRDPGAAWRARTSCWTPEPAYARLAPCRPSWRS